MADPWSYYLELKGERLPLEARELTVGRSRACAVAVKDPSVSRRHVTLVPGAGKVRLTDLGSSNGTYINGKRVQGQGELFDGDTLGLGDADLKVVIVAAADSQEVFETMRMPAQPPREQVGEATSVLQAASMALAQEALQEASPPPAAARPAPPLPPSPGAHMAPPSPRSPAPPGGAGADEPAPAPPPSAALPERPTLEDPTGPIATVKLPAAGPQPSNPMATMRLPTIDAGPSAATPAPPAPAATPEPPPPASPMATRMIPSPEAEPPVLEPPPSASPMATQMIPSLEVEPLESQPAAPDLDFTMPELDDPLRAGLADPAALDPLETSPPGAVELQPVSPDLLDFTMPEIDDPLRGDLEPLPSPPRTPQPQVPRAPDAVSPSAPPSAPVRAAPSPTSPAAPPPPKTDLRQPDDTDDGLLSSLEGFDTTLGPGVEMPESMKRARQNLAAQETEPAAIEQRPLTDLYRQPAQVPPLAGFGVRALAVLLDAVWMGALSFAGWSVLRPAGPAIASGIGLLVVLAGWSVWGTTPGKRALGLYVCTADGQAGLGIARAVLRLVGCLLSGLLLGIGFLMALSSSKRALHDRIAGTYVRRYG